MKAIMSLLGFVSLFLISTGILFKTMHWPGAGISLVVGVFLLNIGYLPLFFFNQYRNAVQEKSNKLA